MSMFICIACDQYADSDDGCVARDGLPRRYRHGAGEGERPMKMQPPQNDDRDHTAGPWTPEFEEAYSVRAPEGGRVCTINWLRGQYGWKGRVPDAEGAANFPAIRTTHVYPPIPIRDFDWSAVTDDYDGVEDSGNRGQIGSGATRGEAIRDLIENHLEVL